MTDPLARELDVWREALGNGSFEETSDALEAVVARLEIGHLRLEDALTCYEIGVQLAERCEEILADAELRVSRLSPLGIADDDWDPDDA